MTDEQRTRVGRLANPWTIKIFSVDGFWSDFCHDAPITLQEAEDRIDELRKENPAATFRAIPWLNSSQQNYVWDLLREQQGELERETAVRKTAESEAHNHAIRTAELYIEREELQAELEKLRHRTDDKAPGTMACRFRGVCEFSQKHAGHNPYSAKSPESTLMESFLAQQAELEALRKAVNLTLGFMDCCDWNDEDSERDVARVVSVCREAARAASEPQAADVDEATWPRCTAPSKDDAIERLVVENKDLHRQRNESWEESHSLREALNRLAAASECLCTPGMEEGCCRCQAYSALNEERPRPFVEELRDENKRLREALEKISAEGFWSSMNSSAELVEILDEHKELADAALAAPVQET